MRDMALPALLDPGEHAVADRQCALAHPFDDPDFRCGGFALPAFRQGHRMAAVIYIDDAQHGHLGQRSEEHTSELQSLMRISYAVFCLKKKKNNTKKQSKCGKISKTQ